MSFKPQRNQEDSINLTPLIDVVFLLLIFFMVTTTFTKESHLSLDLPKAKGESSSAAAASKQIEIVVNARGHYAINGKKLVNHDLKTLMQGLQQEAGDQRDMPLVITADAEASHQSVVTAMDAAGRSGFVHLSISTMTPDE